MGNRIIIGGLDSTPDPFDPGYTTGAQLNTVYSSSFTPTGYDSASWNVTNGEGSTDGSTWGTSGTIIKEQNFYVRGTSSSTFSTLKQVAVTIGGVTGYFNINTRSADTAPDSFSFSTTTNATLSTAYTSSTITVTGLEPSYSITVSASGGTVDAGTSSLSGTFASSKTVTASASGTIVVAARGTAGSSYGATTIVTITIGSGSATYTITTPPAEAVYTSQGNYNWTVPAGVTSICVVCVGGGTSYLDYSGQGGLGGGGFLAYKNNISVTPGQTYVAAVGKGGSASDRSGTESKFYLSGNQFSPLCRAAPGQTTNSPNDYTGDAGYQGGLGGYVDSGTSFGGGGGGAGGYSGRGGNGASGEGNVGAAGSAGTGGGGGGGCSGSNNGYPGGGGGGGVGLYGIGSSGSGGTAGPGGGTPASGGSGGGNASPPFIYGGGGAGGNYGGGAGGYGGNNSNTQAQAGSGAIRIIWGSGKSFPNNAT